MTTTARPHHCPTCRRPVTWRSDNAFRPFCSDRCRLIDLGQWAQEAYRIATPGNPAGAEGESRTAGLISDD